MIGGAVGLVAPAVVLTLLSVYGVWQIMIGHFDLRVILWPFSVMLPLRWCSTVPGILTTAAAMAYNCLAYVGIALLLRMCLNRAFNRLRE